MSRPTDLITVQLYDSSVGGWTDYTNGLLNAVVERGQQEYTGPFTFPDTGTLTITSRNSNLDPYINPIVRYNTQITIRSVSTRMFTGYIEGINVEYQPHGEPPIITIKAIDIIGLLAKHVLSEDFITSQGSWSTAELLANLNTEIPQFNMSYIGIDETAYADAPIELGTTALEALQSRIKTDLGMFVPDRNGNCTYYRYNKDDVNHPYNLFNSLIYFKDDGTGTSYTNINLTDGFTRFVNEIELNGTDATQVILNNQNSINVWGKSSATIDLKTNDINVLQDIGDKALDELAQPQRELTQITYDALNAESYVSRFLSPYRNNISIKHTATPENIIDRKYQIVGVKHEIDFNNWNTTLTLRNVAYQTEGTVNPIITRTPATGTQLTSFTYSFYYPNMNEVTSIEWDVDDGFTGSNNTITVTYPTGGTKTVTLTLNTIYGYAKTVTILYYVGDQGPTSSFTYTQLAENNYQFNFTGTGATSVLWSFGDGTQSTEFNPKKFYLADGNRTVSCQATNYVGSVTSTQTFYAFKVTNIPVKFMKLTFYPGSNWYTDGGPELYAGSYISSMELRKLTNDVPPEVGDLINANWTLVDYEEFGGCAMAPYTFDEYRRFQRRRKVDVVNSLKPSVPTSVAFYRGGLPYTKKALRITIELDDYYQNIQYVRFTGAASKQLGLCDIDVSYDNSTWYKYGQANNSFNGLGRGTFAYNNPALIKPTWTSAVATYPQETLIRYLKVSMQYTSNAAARDYRINELFALGSSCKVNNGTYTFDGKQWESSITDCFGLGGIDLDRNSGALYKVFVSSPETVGAWFIRPDGSSYSYSLFTQSTIPTLNYKNLKDGISWRRTNTFVDIIIDFGQFRTDISGIYLDWRINNTTYNTMSALSTYNVLDFAYSADGQNWTTIANDVSMLRPTNNGAFMIKTTPETIDGITYSPPITSTSTYVIDDLSATTKMRWPT